MIRKISKKEATDSGMALSLLFQICFLFTFSDFFIYASIASLIISMTFPLLLKPFAYIWFGFANVLGLVMTKLILSLLFFIVITPIGRLVNLFREDTLMLKKFKKSRSSVFVSRDHLYEKEDLLNPF